MSLFPTDDKQRKSLPIFKMVTGYFPKALREVTKVCVANNVRYNPEREPGDINWAKGKSPDQLGSAFRHMMERAVDGTVFEPVPPEIAAKIGFDKVYVLAENAWRALAALENEIDEQEAKVPWEEIPEDLQKPYIPYRLYNPEHVVVNDGGQLKFKIDNAKFGSRAGYIYCWAPMCVGHEPNTGTCDV